MKLEHLPEPALEFGSSVPYPVFDPVYGISRLGPYDHTRERDFNTITGMAIGPETRKGPFSDLWTNLLGGVERQPYEPRYEGGLAEIYRLEKVALSTDHEGYLAVDTFAGTIEDKYRSAIQYLRKNCHFDILFIVEPEQGVYYLHNLLRRDCITFEIPSQYLEAETLGLRDRGSVLNNIAVATYAKVGGIPWRVKEPTLANNCILGLSFHIVRDKDVSHPNHTLVGTAEILDEFGRHLTLRVSAQAVPKDTVKRFERRFKSLYVPQQLIETLIKNALNSTQWPGRTPPSRLVLHKTTAFHPEEIAGIQAAFEQLEIDTEYALVHIKEDTVQRVYRQDDKSSVRGMLLTLRDDIPEVVLWPVGKVPTRFWDKGEYQYSEKSGSKIGTADPVAIYLDPKSRCTDFGAVDAAKQVLAVCRRSLASF